MRQIYRRTHMPKCDFNKVTTRGAMYKTRNPGTGNGILGTRGNGGNVIFWGMSPNIPGNITKHFGKCPQTF